MKKIIQVEITCCDKCGKELNEHNQFYLSGGLLDGGLLDGGLLDGIHSPHVSLKGLTGSYCKDCAYPIISTFNRLMVLFEFPLDGNVNETVGAELRWLNNLSKVMDKVETYFKHQSEIDRIIFKIERNKER